MPDYAFSLLHAGDLRYYAVEIDLGSMPVQRYAPSILPKTSVHAKLVAYDAALAQRFHASEYAWPKFSVLILTTTPVRALAIRVAAKRDGSLRHLDQFLVSDLETLAQTQRTADILRHQWADPLGGMHSLRS